MSGDRATKKQQELLAFIDSFIKGTGYGPSYREVMRSLGYKSVSTVATHIDGLIAKGYLIKRDNTARSLEVVGRDSVSQVSNLVSDEFKALEQAINTRIESYETDPTDDLSKEIATLIDAYAIVDGRAASPLLNRWQSIQKA